MTTNVSGRSAQLDRIIEQRRPTADRLRLVVDALDSTISSLAKLAQFRKDLIATLPNDPASESVKYTLASLLPEERIEAARALAARVERLRARFDRPTINVGVVGHARQGKSRLLQTMSGLDDGAIPTSDGSHCTATRSLIAHVPGLKAEADLTFYTSAAFLTRVVLPFYRWNSGSLGLSPNVQTISDLDGTPPKPASSSMTATDRDVYKQFSAYWTSYPQYKALLDKPGSLRVQGSDIRRYLAHAGLNGEEYQNFRAVSSAVVRCEFPYADLGKLALVDLPGLGHHNPNDGDLLSRTLATEVDFVLFVRCPEEMGAAFEMRDTQLYDLAAASVPELPIDQWSLFVLNEKRHAGGGNTKQCEIFKKELLSSSVKTLDVRTVNCASAQDVESRILDFVLEYLGGHITELDRNYSRSVLGAVDQFSKEIRAWLHELRGALGNPSSNPTSDEAIAIRRKFDGIWADVQKGLGDLVRRLQSESRNQSNSFVARMKTIVSLCMIQPDGTPLPSIEAIERKRAQLDGYSSTVRYYQPQLRAHIASALSTLDSEFEQFMNDRKADVTRVLVEDGRIAPQADGRFGEPGEPYLHHLADTLKDYGIKHGDSLLNSLEQLASAKLSYRGFIQHRIRPHFDRLTPDSLERYFKDPIDNAATVRSVLQRLYTITLGELDSAVSSIASEPNAVAYAMVEEFVDRAIRSENVSDTWNVFYTHERFNIWPTEFHALSERSRLRTAWTNSIDLIASELDRLVTASNL